MTSRRHPEVWQSRERCRNFFSIYKRGVIGTYHHLSESDQHRYTAEFDFRYNTRKFSDVERTEEALKVRAGNASSIGNLVALPHSFYGPPRLYGERRVR